MTAVVTKLAALQRRFAALVTAGHGELGGLLSGGELGIYAHAYGARLRAALAADHPKLEAALGAASFAALADAFVAAHPPSSFTLRDLGLGFAAFLDQAAAPPWAAALARLERARIEVFDARDATPLDRDAVAALPPLALATLPLAWVPASEVVTVAWSIDATWAALEAAQPMTDPTPTRAVVLVWRRDGAAIHRTLDADEAVAAPLVAAGTTFAEVCEAIAPWAEEPASRAVELLVRWLDAGCLAPVPPDAGG